MTFIWPVMLAALLVVPALIAAYVAMQRRRARAVAGFTASGLTITGARGRLGRKRHLPFGFFMAAMTIMLFALARPQAALATPHRTGTVILAFDVSNSMLASDIKPTRLDAAKSAARSFVERQPSSIEIGVVAFGDGALVTQPPTTDQGAVLAAIERLSASGSTSLGQGMVSSMSAIIGKPITLPADGSQEVVPPADLGYFGSATILLLTDGENTGGPDPLQVADFAAAAGVHISTIGVGSRDGAVIEVDGYQIATALDEDLLTQIADSTGGTYYRADQATALDKIYRTIDLRLTIKTEKIEITAFVAAIAIALLIAGSALTMSWFGRLV